MLLALVQQAFLEILEKDVYQVLRMYDVSGHCALVSKVGDRRCGDWPAKVPWEEIMAVSLFLIRRERKGGNNKPTITITGQGASSIYSLVK